MGSSFVACGPGLVAAILSIGSAQAQPPSSAPAPPGQQTAIPPKRIFGSDAGLVLNFIKAEKAADFEAIVAKLQQALRKSDKPERARQAAGWRVFRAAEPAAGGAVLYVFVIDPAVKGADYTVSNILAEAFPEEVQTLYERYAAAYASGQNIVNLTLVSALGQTSPVTK